MTTHIRRFGALWLAVLLILALTAPAAQARATRDGADEPGPESESAAGVAPAMPQGDYAGDEMLDAEVIAELDSELAEYLIGTGEPIDVPEGARSILIVGLDARPGETRSRSDTIIVLTVDTRSGAIRMTSFLRDTYVAIPGHGSNRINTAWVFGGFDLLRDTLKQNFGLTVDQYVAVDLTLMTDVFEQLGGLTLDIVSEKQLSAINGVIDGYNYQFGLEANSDFLTETGRQHLNGKQVQAYARYRKIDSDFKRTERQREVLEKVFEKLQGLSVIELSRLASFAMERLSTSLSLSDIISLIPVMLRMNDASFDQLSLPYEGEYQSKTVRGMSVLVPNLKASQARLAAFING